MLSVKNLHISLGNTSIVKNISVEVNAGECLVILGANGAGKSTLISALCGQLPYQVGQICLQGTELNTLDTNSIARQIALVPQQQEMAFSFTALEMVTMGCTPFLSAFAAPGQQEQQQALEILRGLNAHALADKPYNQLSGGERQLILLSRALFQSRAILLLDEPTNHLDYHNQYRILAVIKQACRQRQLAVVVILHDPNQAQLIADKVLMLEHGQAMAYGKTSEVMTATNISRLYSLPSAGTPLGDINWFMPLHMTPKQQPRLLVLTGESGSGKTTLLQTLIKQFDSRIRVQGFITPGEMENGRRARCDIVDLFTGKKEAFGERTNQFDPVTQTRFAFSPSGLTLASEALCHPQPTDICIIDEIGPMEFAGKGVAGVLSQALAKADCTHLWVVRPNLVDALPELIGFAPEAVVQADANDSLPRLLELLVPQGRL